MENATWNLNEKKSKGNLIDEISQHNHHDQSAMISSSFQGQTSVDKKYGS